MLRRCRHDKQEKESMPTGPKTAPKLTGKDRRPGDRPEEHAVAKKRNRMRPNTGTGTAPKMRTAPQSIAKPGRFRFLPGLYCASALCCLTGI